MNDIEQAAADCLKAFKGVKVGAMAWHVTHNRLCEPLTKPARNRIAYILTEKPKEERALRLRLMRPVRADAVAAAWKVYYEAVAAARKVYDEAVAPARKVYDEAVAAARKVRDEAEVAAHAAECPNCPWNGTTIFPEER